MGDDRWEVIPVVVSHYSSSNTTNPEEALENFLLLNTRIFPLKVCQILNDFRS